MKIINNLKELPFVKKGIVTIGTFDGLHIGHRKLINIISEKAKTLNKTSFVITFSNHPFDILSPYNKVKKIIPLDCKINFFNKKEIDYLIFINFDRQFANITHIDFLSILQSHIQDMELVVGNLFKFGKENKGDISFLKQQENNKDFKLTVAKHIYYNNERVSSSRIRKSLIDGDINTANNILDREYCINGKCIKGEGLALTIGFPTINITNHELVIPKSGVYKTYLKIDNKTYSGMTFIGNKSIGNKQINVIETHLFSFNKEIYDQEVYIYFQSRLRDKMVFKNKEELKQQLLIDKEKALKMDT